LAARFDTLFTANSAVSARSDLLSERTPPPQPNGANGAHGVPTLHLANFTPFRLNRLASGVSDHLADMYQRRFGLEIPEWRVIATVGQAWSCTAQHIADSARMHKTRVSRAIAHLVKRGLIERASNADDRREMALRLTQEGRALYEELVPVALERERALLACLSEEELRSFNEGLAKLEEFLGLA